MSLLEIIAVALALWIAVTIVMIAIAKAAGKPTPRITYDPPERHLHVICPVCSQPDCDRHAAIRHNHHTMSRMRHRSPH
jgi:hypothetical protein